MLGDTGKFSRQNEDGKVIESCVRIPRTAAPHFIMSVQLKEIKSLFITCVGQIIVYLHFAIATKSQQVSETCKPLLSALMLHLQRWLQKSCLGSELGLNWVYRMSTSAGSLWSITDPLITGNSNLPNSCGTHWIIIKT